MVELSDADFLHNIAETQHYGGLFFDRAYRDRLHQIAHRLHLEDRLKELEAENTELNELFELQQRRMTEATEAWRSAHPGNEHVLPDLGDLLTWLLSERGKVHD